ncbi:MAG TPA: glycosyl transferase family 2 [Cyanobacteria bacterium UBA8543]|nr:glycosyl transferase family 2 [Cyanobacteria bacterium UBA8543]
MSLVSILIPCYNAEQWIAKTLESAIAQTWQNKEIILVDDGSTDNSLAIAKCFESPIVKVIHQENQGASAARNRALREAQGDLLQYLDADDLLAADKIERQMQRLDEGYSDFVASGEWGRFYNSPMEANFIPEPVWNDMSPVDWLVCSWEGGGMMHPAAWLVPRAIASSAGSWNETLSVNDDGEYFCRVLLASKGVKFCSGAKSYYRSGISGSLSGKTSKTGWESAFRSMELCINHLLNREDNPKVRHACATALQRFVYGAYPDEIDLVKKAEAKAKSLGGSDLKPGGGSIFQLIAKILGWKLAKKIKKFYAYVLLRRK